MCDDAGSPRVLEDDGRLAVYRSRARLERNISEGLTAFEFPAAHYYDGVCARGSVVPGHDRSAGDGGNRVTRPATTIGVTGK